MFTPLFIGADPHCCTAPVKAIVWLWSRHCAAKELKTILRGRGGTFICFHFLSKWSLRDESLTPVRGLWSGWKMGKVNFFFLLIGKILEYITSVLTIFIQFRLFCLFFFRHISGVEPYFHILSIYVFCFLSIFTHLPLWPSAVCPLHHGACPCCFYFVKPA